MSDSNYRFVAFDSSADRWVELVIEPASERSQLFLTKVWHKLSQAVENACKLEESPVPNWVTWRPHEWSTKPTPHQLRLVAWDGDVLAGFLNLRLDRLSVQGKKPIVYVEHVATFPGNISTSLWKRRLSAVGRALLAYAVERAHELGRDRIGLHADADAVAWYNALDNEYNKLFSVRQAGILGLYPNSQTQIYFETSPMGAQSLLEGYRNV